jgi:DNA-binding MarR family transcriptional regulator|nr:MarR family transcriptional regulator [Candidatus Acidoferrales bacterium]
MASQPTESNYRSLAEFRYQIRLFLADSDETARSAGLEPEQFQLLLAVRGMPRGSSATIQRLASRLLVRHNTAVERVDRLARMGLLRRTHSRTDHRVVFVDLSARGKRIVEKLARKRVQELRRNGHELIAALTKVISSRRKSSGRKKRSK